MWIITTYAWMTEPENLARVCHHTLVAFGVLPRLHDGVKKQKTEYFSKYFLNPR